MYKNGHRKVFGSTVYSVIREMLSKGGQKEKRKKKIEYILIFLIKKKNPTMYFYNNSLECNVSKVVFFVPLTTQKAETQCRRIRWSH